MANLPTPPNELEYDTIVVPSPDGHGMTVQVEALDKEMSRLVDGKARKEVDHSMLDIKTPTAYPAANDDFRAARTRAADACFTFNQTRDSASPELRAQRWWDIVKPGYVPPTNQRTLAGQPSPLSNAPYVKPPVFIDYGVRVHVGKSTFINRNFTVLDTPVQDVRIGERCQIGPNVSIYCVSHPKEWQQRLGLVPYPDKPVETSDEEEEEESEVERRRGKCGPSIGMGVIIGDCVWICGNVTILGGVRIGDGAVICAGSVVTKDVPANCYAEGNPARVVGKVSRKTSPVKWVDTLEKAMAANRIDSRGVQRTPDEEIQV